jgi:hypothetical protein
MATEEIAFEDIAALPIALHTVFGSEVHNINYGESSDRDEIAFYVPSLEEALGLDPLVEIYRYRSAFERRREDDYHSHPRSQKGDLDFNIYEISHWAKMALTGSPFILTPLFVEDKWVVQSNAIGDEIRANRNKFLSKNLLTKSLGYMESQYQKMMGLRNNRVHRPELIEAHGFDTKFSAHMVRLAVQALSAAKGDGLQIPVNDEDAAKIRGIRAGEFEKNEIVEWYLRLRDELVELIDTGKHALPDNADKAWVNDWVVRAIRD